ncbi:MAG: PorT family protein [Flavobacteriales bacterium]|nr:PorT family protein [Flavobacteriales bacterium]
MIKRTGILLLFCATTTLIFGQRETTQNLPKFDHRFMHFGFLIGLNSADFVLDRNPPTVNGVDSIYRVEPLAAKGFNLGIISAMHLSEHFSLRFTPNLAFTSRSIDYDVNTFEGIQTYNKQIESTLINFPLSVKYKSARVNNFSAYILFGAAYSLDLASNVNAENNATLLKDMIVKIKRDDYMGEIGFGTDFYLEYFKFGIELKMSYGIKDLLLHDGTPFTNPIEQLRSKMFLLSFTFEG